MTVFGPELARKLRGSSGTLTATVLSRREFSPDYQGLTKAVPRIYRISKLFWIFGNPSRISPVDASLKIVDHLHVLKKLTGGRFLAGIGCAIAPSLLMGLDIVDLFFNCNLPGFHSFKYGNDFIEFFVGSHNGFSTSLYSGA
jgi:hypothetical protein